MVENKDTKQDKKVVAFADKGSKELNHSVKRKEFVEVMQQIFERMNETNHYLMEDINSMYANQVFPVQMGHAVIEELLVEKGIITKEEIEDALEKRKQQLLEKAKAIKTNENGEEELASDDESKAIENEAVLNAMADTESTTEDK
nr:MAG TPA: hypothetical protein [Caudoviricetes sp.]